MNPEDEKYASQLIERMKAQQANIQPMIMPERKPEMLDGEGNVVNEQAVLSSVSNSTGPAPPAVGAFDACPQCGVMHPPLRAGEICPVKKVEVKEAGLKEEDVTKFIIDLRNIAISQIESRGLKDGNKLFKHLTVEFMKILEAYSE
jgi:hypothetical protein